LVEREQQPARMAYGAHGVYKVAVIAGIRPESITMVDHIGWCLTPDEEIAYGCRLMLFSRASSNTLLLCTVLVSVVCACGDSGGKAHESLSIFTPSAGERAGRKCPP